MDMVERVFETADVVAFRPEMRFEGCSFKGFDFTKHEVTAVEFMDCTFTACKFANLKVMNTTWRRVKFEECNLMGVNWCQAKRLEGLTFSNSKLDFGVFQNLDLQRCEIKGCSAREVDFADADLRQAMLSGTDFTGATFQNTKVSGADLRESRGYVFDLKTTSIVKTKLSLPDAAGLLVALGAEIED